MRRRTLSAFFLFLFTVVGCTDSPHHIELALEDGTRVSGIFLSVEDDWVVVDRNIAAPEADIVLVDKAAIDTMIILGKTSDGTKALSIIGAAALGGLGGYWAGEGYIPDSTRPPDPKRTTSATIGALSGVALGAGLGYFLSQLFSPEDQRFILPSEDDFDSVSVYSRFPDGLPPDLREAIDSGWEIRSQ